MGNLRSAKRQLKKRNVWIAQEVEVQRVKLAQKAVEERCKKDAEFAADVLKAVGENLPQEIKDVAEETIKRETLVKSLEVASDFNPEVTDAELQTAADDAVKEDLKPIIGGDLTHEMVPVQTDGGGEILVHPTQLPDYPRDGK